MRYAIVEKEKKLAFKGGKGTCPICNSTVRAYCGNLKSHHWKHENNKDCDFWSEGMTQWHIDWQNCFPKDMQEVTIKKSKIKHRADVFNSERNLTIEFQNSPISSDKIKERELFYGKMVWVINGCKSIKNISFETVPIYMLHEYLNFPKNFRNTWDNKFSFRDNDYKTFINNVYNDLLINLTMKFNFSYSDCSQSVKEELSCVTISELLYKFKNKEYKKTSKSCQDLISTYLEKLNLINQDYIEAKRLFEISNDFYYLKWKYKPQSWNESVKSKFIDVGDVFLYKIYEIDIFYNILTVRKISKKSFIEECKKKEKGKSKKLKNILEILYLSTDFEKQEKFQIDILNYHKNKKEENNNDEVYYIRPWNLIPKK